MNTRPCLFKFAVIDNTFRVELKLDISAPVRTRFSFVPTAQDQEDLGWHLDYLEYRLDPAPKVAERFEVRMLNIGEDLFCNVLESGEIARQMWARLQPELNDTSGSADP